MLSLVKPPWYLPVLRHGIGRTGKLCSSRCLRMDVICRAPRLEQD